MEDANQVVVIHQPPIIPVYYIVERIQQQSVALATYGACYIVYYKPPNHSSLFFCALSLCLVGLLRLLLVLAQRLGDKLLQLGVLQLLLSLDELGLIPHWRLCDQRRAGREKGNCEVERCDKRACGSVAARDTIRTSKKPKLGDIRTPHHMA